MDAVFYPGSYPTLAGNNAFTGANTFTNAAGIVTLRAATQDAVQLLGRAGGTGSWKQVITTAALTATRTLTLPDADTTITGGGTLALGGFTLTVPATGTTALLAAGNAFTGANTFTNAAGIVTLQAATQDAMQLLGRAGGTGSFKQIITTATLSASRTLTLPDANTTITGGGTLALGGFTLTVPATGTAALLGTSNTFTNGSQIISAGTVTFDLLSTSNTITQLRLYANNALQSTWQADNTSTRLVVNSNNLIVAPAAGTSLQIPTALIVGVSAAVGTMPLSVSPSSWPTTVPTANQVGFCLGTAGDISASYRCIGAGYYTGATYVPCLFGYLQTSTSGFSYGKFLVATRASGSDVAPTVNFTVEPNGQITIPGTTDGILAVSGKITAKAAVPGSFADLAAVQTYLASILT